MIVSFLETHGRTRNRKLPALIACLALLVLTVDPSTAQDDGIYWADNYSEALKEAKRTQKPIFLEFRCEP